MRMNMLTFDGEVLILIFLENALRLGAIVSLSVFTAVLILIFLENALRRILYKSKTPINVVLILIFLENALRHNNNINNKACELLS